MVHGLFITGTGTDVGKTVVTAALARFLVQSGRKVLPVKPVQSGGIPCSDGSLDSPDGEVYKSAGAQWIPEEQCPYIFQQACSPHLAAGLNGVTLDIQSVADAVTGLEVKGFLLAEGAGGILVPLNDESTMLDLMVLLDYPVVLVSANKLGSINETLLSINMLRQAGLSIAGIIMTSPEGPAPEEFGMAQDNIRTIENFSGVKVLASIPYISNWDYKERKCWVEVDKAFADIDPAVLTGLTG